MSMIDSDEFYFRNKLLHLCSEDPQPNQIFDLLDKSLNHDHDQNEGPGFLTVTLLEDVFDLLGISSAEMVCSYIEKNQISLTSYSSSLPLASNKGKGLVLLRLCNDLLKKLSKLKHSVLCGRILLILSRAFPTSERSAVNLRSEINAHQYTIGLNFEKTDGYGNFWNFQQNIFSKGTSFSEIKNYVEEAVEISKENISKNSCLFTNEIHKVCFFPSHDLFQLQLKDSTFHALLLTQFLIILNSDDKMPPLVDKRVFCDKILNALISQFSFLNFNVNFSTRLLSFLVFVNEQSWKNWKSISCPNFEKPISFNFENEHFDIATSFIEINSGFYQKSENISKTFGSTDLKDHDVECNLSRIYLEQREQGIDDEFAIISNSVYYWTLLRSF